MELVYDKNVVFYMNKRGGMIFMVCHFWPDFNPKKNVKINISSIIIRLFLCFILVFVTKKLFNFCKYRKPPYHPDRHNTVYPGSTDPFYIVTCYTKWVTTSWTYSRAFTLCSRSLLYFTKHFFKQNMWLHFDKK